MYTSQTPWVDLYYTTLDYNGSDIYQDVLAAWPQHHAAECDWLESIAEQSTSCEPTIPSEDLCRLYAVSRVTTLLALSFQPGVAATTEFAGHRLSVKDFSRFHQALGFRIPSPVGFHPFFHEIVRVQLAPAPATPIESVAQLWPPLMLGRLMFFRGGAVVAGGTNHIDPKLAERSKLYWAYWRRNRPYEDLSHGWGSNSQWRTSLRLDFETPHGYRYNATAEISLNGRVKPGDGIPVATLLEVVRHRCLIYCTTDIELYPYRYSYEEAR